MTLEGGTIVVGGIHARLKGMVAPEVICPGYHKGGEEAREFLVTLVEG